MLALHEDDLVISASTAPHVRTMVSRKRRNGSLVKYGRGQWDIPRSDYLETDAVTNFRFLDAYLKHINALVGSVKSLAVKAVEQGLTGYNNIEFSHAGIVSAWSMNELNEFIGIKDSAVIRETNGFFSRYPDSTAHWGFATPEPRDSSIVSQAYVEARMRLLDGQLSSYSRREQPDQYFWVGSLSIRPEIDAPQQDFIPLSGWSQFQIAYDALTGPVSGKLVFSARNDILAARRVEANNRERVARELSRENFTKYWSALKSTIKSVVDSDEVQSAWQTIPIMPKGTASSRTWGIEIETVQAQLVRRPLGWDERGDGSLEPMEYGCDCGCESCDEGEHCEYDDCGSNNCAEFVSPILNHFNSDGLRKLCRPLEHAPVNTTPGIHVHVGAGDLSVTDVARLIRAYSAVSPFIVPLSHRKVTNYCHDVTTNNLAHWLAASRSHMKRTSNDRAVDVSNYQPDNRYHDLNLTALQAHGTVEFRVMGPYYNYEHLVRWAWFCREMVNLSKLDIPQTTWTSVRSMADVLAIIKQYGTESTPDSWLSETDDLVVESLAEAESD